MIKVENVNVSGWEAAIRGMRNPMNSWDKSDSHYIFNDEGFVDIPAWAIGPNDLHLMTKLALAGSEHAKYRRMIIVTMDITAPLYWWKEFDTYKVGTVANSCSTMHKIAAKEFTEEDFSSEHLLSYFMIGQDDESVPTITVGCGDCSFSPAGIMELNIKMLNECRERYFEALEKEKNHSLDPAKEFSSKQLWLQMIQLLPSSYNQRRTVQFSYENVAAMFRQRCNHKLNEWRELCAEFKKLPYFDDIVYPLNNTVYPLFTREEN